MGLVGCASSPLPESNQARLVESTSASEVMIRAQGIGSDVDAAEEDARLAAVWYALYGGDHPLLADAASRHAFAEHEEEIFADARSYIGWESDILGSRQEGGDRVVEKNVRVNIARLSDDLVARDVIEDSVDVMDRIGRPRIAVLPRDAEHADDTRPAIVRVSEYLQERGFDVEVPEADERVDEVIGQVAALEGHDDPMHQLALEVGSDVYITLDVDHSAREVGADTVRSAVVTAVAFYTATADQIGASSGHSPERDAGDYGVLAEEAASETANRVLNQIDNSWLDVVERGRPFKVVTTTDEGQAAEVGRELHRLFNDLCAEANRNAAGSASFDYTLRCHDQGDAVDLLYALQDGYEGPGELTRVLDSGGLLILEAGDGSVGGSGEIRID
ncbi:hypothetical protein CKO14_10495 [Halorhodospira halophila]|nr:hypothetical protein [Halorhodospira halophila]